MNTSLKWFALSLVLLIGHGAEAAQQQTSGEIVMCSSDIVPKEVQQANASFPLTYRLDLGASGEVKVATKLQNDFVPDANIKRCLELWKLPVQNSTALINLNWQHGKGWTSLSISMPGLPIRIIRFR